MALIRNSGRILSGLLAVFVLMAGLVAPIAQVSGAETQVGTPIVIPPANDQDTGDGPAPSPSSVPDETVALAAWPIGPFVTNNGNVIGGLFPVQSGCVVNVEFWNFALVPDPAFVLIEAIASDDITSFIEYKNDIIIEGSIAGGPTDIDASFSMDIRHLLEAAGPYSSDGYRVELTVGVVFNSVLETLTDLYMITDCIVPTPTETPTPVPTETPTPVPTETPTPVPTETPTPVPTETPTPVPTETPTPVPTETPTPVPTETPTPVPTVTPTPQPTATATPTPSPTVPVVPTATSVPTAIPTATVAPPPPTATFAPTVIARPANPREAPIVPPEDPTTSDGTRAGQISIVLNEGVNPTAFGARYDLTLLEFVELIRLALYSVPDGVDIAALTERIAGDADVGITEANSVLMAPEGHGRSMVQFSQPVNLRIPNPAYGYDLVGAVNVGCVTGEGVIVAVIDTGIDVDHPLFKGRLLPGWNVIDGNDDVRDTRDGIDNDGDNITDEMYGHGTHVAGIVARVAPGAMILPVRVLNDDGVGDAFGLAQGIVFAVTAGADVINLSLSSVTDSKIVRKAIEYAHAEGVVVVAATGNAGHAEPKEFPAAIEGVIAVAATGPDDLKAAFSNYGSEIRMSAPGTEIESALPDGKSGPASGTSMAAPFIAAAAALTIERYPDMTPDEIADRIESASQKIDPLNPEYAGQLGAGRLDLINTIACSSD